jgi:beta-N-acetylhexosaminidase
VLGRWDDPATTETVGHAVGVRLRDAGCTVTFAPDADINSNPNNPVIGVRSFGSAPDLVARHTAAWVHGVQSVGIAACAKHFPGHGDTAQDSHLALPVVDRSLDELRERELKPFEAAIAAGTRSIMTSHILLPQLDDTNPATFSRRIIQGLLRDELGFDGVIVTDALDMRGASGETGIPEAAVRALAAGCDLLCIGTKNTDAQLAAIEDAVLAAIDDGRLGESAVRKAADRVRELGHRLADEREVPPTHEAEPSDDELARVVAAFDVIPAAAAWRDANAASYAVIRMQPLANMAVGVVPWGPFAASAGGPRAAVDLDGHPLLTVTGAEPIDLDAVADGAAAVLVVGRDNHQHAFVRDAVDGLRHAGRDVLVVDMGWPSDDRRYADVATFGASRLLGTALMAWLKKEMG